MNRSLTWLCLVSVLFIPGSAAVEGQLAQPAAESSQEVHAVQFELLRSMHIAVPVKINGTGPYRLIFDLGAPIVLVSGKAGVQAGLISQKVARRPALFGMRGQVKARSFQVGDVEADDVEVIVMDHPTVQAAARLLGPIDGIVGYPFFARYKFTIDYQSKTMTFRPGAYEPKNVMGLMVQRLFAGSGETRLAPAGLWGLSVTKSQRDDQAGVTVERVWPASPAEKAGLRAGDRVLQIDDRWTDSVPDIYDAASFCEPGTPVAVQLLRDGKPLTLEVSPAVGL